MFPEIDDYDFSQNTEGMDHNLKVAEAIDWAVMQYTTRRDRHERIDKLYNAHNGVIDQSEIDSIIKFTGKKSKTKYVKYRLGRSKLKLVHGEFLEIGLTPTVRSVNRSAQNEKMQKYKRMLGLSLGKPYIEASRSMGYDLYTGVKIPDREDKSFWHANNFKLSNEIVMQHIIDDKMENLKLKSRFYNNFIDLTIAAEMFGKIERNANGIDTYRPIQPRYALFEESVYDPLMERTPYMGEVRFMYYHELMSNPEWKLSKTQKAQIKNFKDTYTSDPAKQGSVEMMNGSPAFPVYTIQWKGLETVYLKVSKANGSNVPYKRILSEKYYLKNHVKIQRDVKNGKYTVEKFYRQVVWTASKIMTDVYTQAEKIEDVIQIENENGKFTADYDYVGFLFNTVNGYRVSLQEIVYELEKVYDDTRFQINRELKKVRGSVIQYDEAFLPKKKRFIDIYHSISEDGVMRFNTAAEGNQFGIEGVNPSGMNSVKVGDDQTLIALINNAMDIERVMDRLTGINENRQGLTKATTTATANVNNIEASRSMTYDLFYFMGIYIEQTLKKLAEKTKLNRTYEGMDSRQFIMDEAEIKHLVSTKNLRFDNYGVSVTDGKREKDILAKVEQFFPAEINAGQLRTKDVIRFMAEGSFASALKILDEAHEEVRKVQERQSRIAQEAKQAETEGKVKIATEDREDGQVHDKEMEVIRTEGKKEVEQLKIAGKGLVEGQKQAAESLKTEEQDISL
jgi:hypothetical protein